VHYTGMLPIKRQKHSTALCIRYKHPHRAANKRSENKHPKCMTKLLQAGRLQHLVPHVTRPTLCRISTACSTSNAAPSPNVHALAVTGLCVEGPFLGQISNPDTCGTGAVPLNVASPIKGSFGTSLKQNFSSKESTPVYPVGCVKLLQSNYALK
jgi:hypothetical protein